MTIPGLSTVLELLHFFGLKSVEIRGYVRVDQNPGNIRVRDAFLEYQVPKSVQKHVFNIFIYIFFR